MDKQKMRGQQGNSKPAFFQRAAAHTNKLLERFPDQITILPPKQNMSSSVSQIEKELNNIKAGLVRFFLWRAWFRWYRNV